MLKVLIIDGEEDSNVIIAKGISELYSDVSIVNVTTIDDALEHIKNDKPDIAVINIDMKDPKGRNILERLMSWEFKILIFQTGELYEIMGNKAQKHGYVFKKQ